MKKLIHIMTEAYVDLIEKSIEYRVEVSCLPVMPSVRERISSEAWEALNLVSTMACSSITVDEDRYTLWDFIVYDDVDKEYVDIIRLMQSVV